MLTKHEDRGDHDRHPRHDRIVAVGDRLVGIAPIPVGHKIVSMMTVPPSKLATWMPATVRIGKDGVDHDVPVQHAPL